MSIVSNVLCGILLGTTTVCIGGQLRESELRTSYPDKSKIPDGVAFHHTVDHVSRMTHPDDSEAVQLIMDRMNVTSEVAKDVLYLMISASRLIATEVDSNRRRLLCESGPPQMTREEIYAQIEKSEDDREEISAKHLRLFEHDIGAENSIMLHHWLDSEKSEMKYYKVNIKALYERIGHETEEKTAIYCHM